MTLAPNQEYHSLASPQTVSRPERRGVSRRRVIEEAKVKVPVIDLADLQCGPAKMRRVGDEWIARCPLPDHEDTNPSFTVNSEKNVWWCFGCLRGGDVVELARFAWGYSKQEAVMAAADLLHEFGHPIPPRPDSWYAKQERQSATRAAVEQTRKNVVRRRLFKHLILPLLDAIEDEEERNREVARAWRDFQDMLA